MTRPAFDLALRVDRGGARVVLRGPTCAPAFGVLAASDVIPLDGSDTYGALIASAAHLVATSTACNGARQAAIMGRFRRRAAYVVARMEVDR